MYLLGDYYYYNFAKRWLTDHLAEGTLGNSAVKSRMWSAQGNNYKIHLI